MTDRGDGGSQEVSASYGTSFAGGRGHVLGSAEYFNQEGIFDYAGRDWYQGWGTLGSGTAADPYTFQPNLISRNASFDGVIFAPGTAVNGLAFDRAGNVAPFVSCTPAQAGPVGVPPARHVAPPGSGCSGDDLGAEAISLYPDIDRYSLFAYAEYELTDSFKVFAQYLHGRTSINQFNAPRSSFGGTPTALTIFQDNAFLPETVRQTMIANNIPSFTLRRMGSLSDIGTAYLDDETTQHIGVGGFEYDFAGDGFLGGWQVNGFYQYGHSKRDWRQFGLRVDRIFAAVDAVRDPETGNIVCRTSLFGDAFPGCQPINLFGRGNASPGAVDYVTGFEPGQQIDTPLFFADNGFADGETYSYTTSAEKVNLTTFEQHFAEIAASGDLVDLWAGPIALAAGASYRKDSIRQIVQDVTNPASNHETGHPVLCNGEAPGLRGVSVPDCLNTVGVQYSKVSNIDGAADVYEAFGEVLVPLVDTDNFTVNLNGAVRWADYSGSGSIWAYKGGLEVGLADMLRLRGTYSRDVRAANLSERFDRTGGSAVIDDPRTPDVVEAITVTRFSGGNPNVKPEQADTFTAGAVFQPEFVPGLSLSLDWYRIQLNDAIGQVGNQQVVNNCFLRNQQEFCDLVTVDPSTDQITLVGDVFVNIGKEVVSGLDLETSYKAPFALFGGDEDLSLRLFASWLFDRTVNGVDLAGQTGARQTDQVYFPYADFKATGNIAYRNGGFSTLVQARYIGEGEQDADPNVFIEDNTVSSALYIDLRLGYTLEALGGDAELFFNVTNLFDEDPPLTPSYSAFLGYSTQVNTQLYDVLGRRYTIGTRLRF